MGVSVNILSYHSPSSKLPVDKAWKKVLLSDNYLVNLTTRC